MILSELKPTERFSNRVIDYVKYRPSYPSTLLDYLEKRMNGLKGKRVADIGAGTGIFSRLLLELGAEVFAVEPNADMFRYAKENLGSHQGFHPVEGTAETTGLPEQSIDLVACAQAFHWFDLTKTRLEFSRILKPEGRIALIWNFLDPDRAINQRYDEIKSEVCGLELKKVTELTGNLDIGFDQFFTHQKCEHVLFDNFQTLDRQGLLGRFFSSSYAPLPDTEMGRRASAQLNNLFSQFQQNEIVKLEYKTELYFGA